MAKINNLKEDSGKMRAIYSTTVRELISICNENNIKKEEVVNIIYEDGQYMLIYFR